LYSDIILRYEKCTVDCVWLCVVQAILQKGSDETVSAKQSQDEKLSKSAASACSHKANKKDTEVHMLTYC